MIALLAASAIVCTGGGESPVPSESEIVALIDALVSPNAAPVTDGPTAEYPKGYDEAAQARVSATLPYIHDYAQAPSLDP